VTETEQALVTRVVESGAELTGSIGGVAIGLLAGGSGGAIAGAAAGPVIVRVIKDVASRILSHREQVRVGASLEYGISRIQERLDAGDRLRDDGFFSVNTSSSRSDADEIIEGVLLAAQRSYEERKVRFLGYLIANISFEPIVDRGLANHLIKLSETLSYRQLCLLSLVSQHERFELPGEDQRIRDQIPWSVWSITRDLAALGFGELEIVGEIVTSEPRKTARPRLASPNPAPSALRPVREGVLLVELMDLRSVDDADLEETLSGLRGCYTSEK
jgi:hypothetical protein